MPHKPKSFMKLSPQALVRWEVALRKFGGPGCSPAPLTRLSVIGEAMLSGRISRMKALSLAHDLELLGYRDRSIRGRRVMQATHPATPEELGKAFQTLTQ